MKTTYASRLAEGQTVDDVFALRGRELHTARTGDQYLSLELSDRSGVIRGTRFRPTVAEQSVPTGAVVRVAGTVTSYRGAPRLSVTGLAAEKEFDMADLVPAGPRDTAEMLRAFRAHKAKIDDERLRRLVGVVFEDRSFRRDFCACPGAQSHHHAYSGGLLEHTVAVATIASGLADLYERVDRSLLLTAALLHDVGKVDELRLDTTIAYTDAGRLLGHVVLGERRVAAAAIALGDVVPEGLALRLSHILLSHHGELEWGAPKRPSVLEAVVLHHADNLDAKVSGFVQAVSGAGAVEERWSDMTNLFRRPLFVPRAAEDERWYEPREDDQYASRSA